MILTQFPPPPHHLALVTTPSPDAIIGGAVFNYLCYLGIAGVFVYCAKTVIKETEGVAGLFGLATLFFAFLLFILNAWQQNNIEKVQIEIRNELKTIQKRIASGAISSGGSGSQNNSNAQVAAAMKDDSNLLELDPDDWLPIEAETGGTLIGKVKSDPKGLNYLIENGADVSEIQAYNHISLMRNHFNDISKY